MNVPLATAANLRAANRNPLPQIEIALDDGRLLAIERWLRILPGKRLTGIGAWQGHHVLAKLFIAARGSERHWQRECRGAERLKAHALPTPALIASGQLGDGGYYVLYDYLENARNPDTASATDLSRVFEQVGRMHVQGLLQADAHLGNFLIGADQIYLIDGDAIRESMSPAESADNLALLLAQLQPEVEAQMRPALLTAYRGGNPRGTIDEAQLSPAVIRAREARLANYLDKCLRDCSLFKSAQRADKFFSIVRAETDLLVPLIHDPDTWLEKGIPLKRGRTATLSLVEVGGRQLVLKRYNIKNAGHALSRCWRPSRAWHSWIAAHRLRFLGIATPRPLALVEQRFGPLRGRAWLVSKYCPGTHLATHLAPYLDTPPAAEVAAIVRLFVQLATARITHGDLKATNLLWHAGKLHLVDLDAMRQHTSAVSFARAWRKDRERLLRNWPAGSALHAALAAVLPET